MEYNINKGIGRNVEFNGLQAQYLYFFVGGLLAIFLLFVIFYMIGIDRWYLTAASFIKPLGPYFLFRWNTPKIREKAERTPKPIQNHRSIPII